MLKPIWNTYPGNIGDVLEGSPFTFALNYTNPLVTPITLQMIAGSLPPGLTMSPLGVISGTVLDEPLEKSYSFAVRLTNAQGFADRSFTINIQDNVPVWNDPTNMGTYVHYSLFEYQFFVLDPGGSVQTFKKISGALPPGLEFDPNGRLHGLLYLLEADQTFTFTIRAYLDGDKFEDRTFSVDVVILGNRAPLWTTPAGLLGDITATVPYTFQLTAGDPDSDTINFSAVGLPPGISINPATGLLSGTLTSPTPTIYTFSVTATDSGASSSRVFSLNANEAVVFPISWITEPGDLGSDKEGHKSLFYVRATSESPWLRYEITAGSLPAGLTLDINTGDIWGQVQNQVATDTLFNFTVRVYNQTTELFGDFTLTIEQALDTGATQVYAKLFGNDKLLWLDLFTSPEIVYPSLFQQGNDEYGLVETPKIIIAQNLDAPTKNDLYNEVLDVRRTYLTLGKVEVAAAVKNGEFVYEVLYRRIVDDSDNTLEEFNWPQGGAPTKPGSIRHLRNRLLNVGVSGGEEQLPLFMTSEQVIGDSSSVLGYFPCIVFAYVRPGEGQAIADKINNADSPTKQERLFLRRVRVDRFVMEPFANSDFDPQYVLFDNQF